MGTRIDFVRRAPPSGSADFSDVATVDFVEPNLNVLAHAQTLELEVGSRCGGHGICGGDRVRVLGEPPLSEITEAERRHLSKKELAAGIRLACQCFPNDSTISLRVEIFPDGQ
ncbi:MAG: 2Fe-2S iron-sulfur cluster binding domain-containing protein [Bdellovibrionales bacterium]|nr:2Fe-2S iron-sulfur cluster binding domain-containing protein [Bdellovibrionales bacterium]